MPDKREGHKFFISSFIALHKLPNSRCKIVRDKFIIWEGRVTSYLSDNQYTICINYEKGYPPRIWIVDPRLDLEKKYIPHVYRASSNSLCLYHPDDWKWSVEEDIISTIVLWSQAWIVYYEAYKTIGEWIGPEAEHDLIDKIDEQTSRKKNKKKRKHNPYAFLKDYPVRYDCI